MLQPVLQGVDLQNGPTTNSFDEEGCIDMYANL